MDRDFSLRCQRLEARHVAVPSRSDVYTIFEPQITVEVLQDTRCEGLVVIGLGDGATESPDLTSE